MEKISCPLNECLLNRNGTFGNSLHGGEIGGNNRSGGLTFVELNSTKWTIISRILGQIPENLLTRVSSFEFRRTIKM
jgi:hypothetical protein